MCWEDLLYCTAEHDRDSHIATRGHCVPQEHPKQCPALRLPAQQGSGPQHRGAPLGLLWERQRSWLWVSTVGLNLALSGSNWKLSWNNRFMWTALVARVKLHEAHSLAAQFSPHLRVSQGCSRQCMWDIRTNFFSKESWCSGTGCPGNWGSAWRCSRPMGTWHRGPWSVGTVGMG